MTTSIGGVPVDETTCFSDEQGRPHGGVEKEQRKLLEKAGAALARVLEPGETIRYAAASCSPYSVLELLTTGRLINSVRRCLLVATDRRILHLPTSSGLRPRGSVAQVRYGDVEDARPKALGGKLVLGYRNGKSETFSRLKGRARKKLAALIPTETSEPATAMAGRHPICPRCGEALRLRAVSCGRCALPFKERSRALLLALVVPGGGYFYTGRTLFGVMDAFVEILLLLGLLIGVVDVATDHPESWSLVGVAATFLALEKLISVFHTLHYVDETLPSEKLLDTVPAVP